MQCSKCGTPAAEGDVFCGTCGAPLGEQAAQPTQPMPTQPPSPQPGAPTQPLPPQPGAPTQPSQPPLPKKRSKAGVIVLIVVLGVFGLCAMTGVGGFFLWRSLAAKSTPPSVAVTPEPAAEPTAAPSAEPTPVAEITGFPTPDEAVKAQLQKGWQYKLAENEPTKKEYWVGPPASEWAAAFIVEKGAEGGWTVTSTKPLGQVGEEESEDPAKAEAVALVTKFETYIKDGQPAKAQKLTIDPFHSDPASAQYAGGEFLSFEIVRAEPAGDGTYWVFVKERWKTFVGKWKLHVVTTEAGLRINELTVW